MQRTVNKLKGRYVWQAPKAGRGRLVAIDADTVAVLRRHRARQNEERLHLGDAWRDQGLVFPGATGELLLTSTVNDQWRRALTASGLPAIRFHDLRHTHATLLLIAGVHPKIDSERLGHASISMTLDIYSHVIPQMQQGAADAFAALLKAS